MAHTTCGSEKSDPATRTGTEIFSNGNERRVGGGNARPRPQGTVARTVGALGARRTVIALLSSAHSDVSQPAGLRAKPGRVKGKRFSFTQL